MLHWWWSTLRPWRPALLVNLLLLFGDISLTLALVPLAGKLEPLVHHLELKSFWSLLGIICLIYVGKQLLDYFQQVILAYISTRWMLTTRQESFETIMSADWQTLKQISPNQNFTVLSDDLEKIQQALWSSLHQLLPGILTLSALLIVLFWFSWPLSLAVLTIFPLAILILNTTGKHLNRETQDQQKAQTGVIQELNESLHNMTLVRLYDLAHFRTESLKKAQKKWFHHRWQALIWQHLESPLLGSLHVTLIALLLGFASWLVATGHLSGANLLAFATALALAIDPGLWTAESLAKIRASRTSWERLQTVQSLAQNAPPDFTVSQQAQLEIHHLSCSFEHRPILKNIDLNLKPGQKIGLTGSSGSGKSTLLKILAGLERNYQGQIALPENWHYKDIILIPQRAPLFQCSLRENICLDLNPSPEELNALLHICQINPIISRLKDGLDTVADTRGNWLSGGELQRLALARALLRKPRLLLLDEASSELDLSTEHLILQALQKQDPQMAIILVSHRPQSLQGMETLWKIEHKTLIPGALH